MSSLELTPTVRHTLALTLEGGPVVVLGEATGIALEFARRGPQGPPGSAGVAFTHTQVSAAATWVVAHNLGFRPTVSIVSAGGIEVDAEVAHITSTLLEVRFGAPFAGTARLT